MGSETKHELRRIQLERDNGNWAVIREIEVRLQNDLGWVARQQKNVLRRDEKQIERELKENATVRICEDGYKCWDPEHVFSVSAFQWIKFVLNNRSVRCIWLPEEVLVREAQRVSKCFQGMTVYVGCKYSIEKGKWCWGRIKWARSIVDELVIDNV